MYLKYMDLLLKLLKTGMILACISVNTMDPII